MSKHACCLAVLLALAGVSERGYAQRPSAERIRDMQQQLDSLIPALRIADSVYQVRADSAQRAERASQAEELDTAMVGPFTIVSRPNAVGRAESYVGDMWRDIENIMQGSESRLRGITILLESGDPVRMFAEYSERPRHLRINMPLMLTPAARRVHLKRVVGGELSRTAPREVRTWLNDAPLSWEADYAYVYRQLATARAAAANRCFSKDVQSCKAALGLVPTDSVWSNWYSSAQLRELVAEIRSPVRDTMRTECLGVNKIESCAAYLRQNTVGAPLPLSENVRASFLTFALMQGGQGSFARLLSARGDVADRIATAAGQPIDKVVADWRTEVQRSRPDVNAGMTGSRLAVLFWLILGLGLAMRSTRWRLG